MEEANENRGKTTAQKWGRLITILIVAALFVIGLVQALSGSKGFVVASVDDQRLGVAGTYDERTVFVALDTITEVQLVDTFDFGACVDGQETGNTVSGIYSCEEFGEYTAHSYTEGPYIIVHSSDGVLVFNCGSRSNTEDLYEQLTEAAGLSE